MLKLIADLDLGSVWFSLSVANKSFFLYFCGVAVYTLSLCLYVFVSLPTADRTPKGGSGAIRSLHSAALSGERSCRAGRTHCRRLRVGQTDYSDDSNRAENSLDKLKRRLANLRQLHLFTLYLFGFYTMISIPNVFVTFGDSKTWPIGQYIRGISPLRLAETAE